MKIGAQLYTLRDYCKTLEDFSETLKKVADIGYSTVQVSGTCAYEADWLAKQLKSAGLHCGVTHYNYDRIVNETEKVIDEHKTFGCHCIGIGGMPNYANDHGEKFLSEIGPVAQKIYDSGLQFTYHNHSFEYTDKAPDGSYFLKYLSETFTPEQMNFTLDTYWVKHGGFDVIEEIKRLSGRMEVVHFKDMFVTESGEHKMSWVGGGNALDFEKIAEAFIAAGSKYAYIEQDDCNGEDPFDCLKKSYEYLKSIGLN